MGVIRILDKNTADKIAAGEVVENPAAAVKELVENSLDARSKKIDIIVTKGGMREIIVVDDGEGMLKEDLPLALARHATSKIFNAVDLESVKTLGFRGEALASIASVSRLTIISRKQADIVGCILQAEGGEVTAIKDSGAATGTRVEIRDLYYNTPGRRKFITSLSRETNRIINLINRMAMAYPEISFSLTVDGRNIFTSAGNGSLLSVLTGIYKPAFPEQFIEVLAEGKRISIKGYTSIPSFNRGGKYHQTFFVNRRYILEISLNQALNDAYHACLPKGRYPLCAVNLFIDPLLVDVNVHPAKSRIRFADLGSVTALLREAVIKSLKKGIFPVSNPALSYSPVGEKEFENEGILSPLIYQNETHSYIDAYIREEPAAKADKMHDGTEAYRLIGQFAATYIMYEDSENNLFVVDQHAAHERILYEDIKQKAERQVLYSQQIIPETLNLDSDLIDVLAEKLSFFLDLGFDLEEFGPGTYIVRAVPYFLESVYSAQLMYDIFEEVLRENKQQSSQEFQDKILFSLACKAAVKAREFLTETEMYSLIYDVSKTGVYNCPHGRPAILKIAKKEMAKYFLRNS